MGQSNECHDNLSKSVASMLQLIALRTVFWPMQRMQMNVDSTDMMPVAATAAMQYSMTYKPYKERKQYQTPAQQCKVDACADYTGIGKTVFNYTATVATLFCLVQEKHPCLTYLYGVLHQARS